jgi:adenylate kinase family enzyme
VALYVAKLRMTYEYKSKERLKSALESDAKKELELTRQVANLEEELRQMQDPESKVKRKKKRTPDVVEREIAEKQAELEQVKVIENNGWILVDFPTNFGQAMLLEQALSGYQLPADLEPTQREREAKDAELLVKPTAKPAPPKTLTPSGLDAVIWFDASREECLRRALGRRVDGQNEVVYHIQDNPPSIDQSPLCEIIEPIDDERESTACLVDRWVAFDQASSGLAKWLTQFGDEASSSNLLTRIDAGGDAQAVYE